MRYLLFFTCMLIFMNLSAQDAEYHKVTDDPHIRQLIKEGLILLRNKSEKTNPNKAYLKFLEAANSNDHTAQFIIGEMYENGIGVKKDQRRSYEWYLKSAQNGDMHAMYRVGLCYKDGKVTEQDFEKAVLWFQKSIEAGNPVGNYLLGYMYYKGLGVKQSYKEAYRLAKESADTGNTPGKHLMAYCLEHGHGVAPDKEKAEKLYNECAEKGYEQSKVRLAKIKEEKQKGKTKSAQIENSNLSDKILLAGENYIEIDKGLKLLAEFDFSGEWEGFLYVYDWAKSQIDERSNLQLTINQNGNTVLGNWENPGLQSCSFTSIQTGNVLVFNDLSIVREGAYGTPMTWNVKNGQFEVIESEGNVYLAGNLELHNSEINEPYSPCSVILKRSHTGQEFASDNISKNQEPEQISNILSDYFDDRMAEMKVFPNPTRGTINIQYTLTADGNTQISLISLEGRMIREIKSNSFENTGDYKISTSVDGIPGTYIIKLVHNGQVYTNMLIKN